MTTQNCSPCDKMMSFWQKMIMQEISCIRVFTLIVSSMRSIEQQTLTATRAPSHRCEKGETKNRISARLECQSGKMNNRCQIIVNQKSKEPGENTMEVGAMVETCSERGCVETIAKSDEDLPRHS